MIRVKVVKVGRVVRRRLKKASALLMMVEAIEGEDCVRKIEIGDFDLITAGFKEDVVGLEGEAFGTITFRGTREEMEPLRAVAELYEEDIFHLTDKGEAVYYAGWA